MKKTLTLMIVLFIILVGCSNDEVTDEQEKKSSSKEILTKTIEQAALVSNVMVDFSIKQQVELPEIERDLTVEQSDSTYLEADPFRFLTELDTPYGHFTIFNQNEELYSYDSHSDTYEKINLEPLNKLHQIIKEQRHLPILLDKLRTYEEKMNVEENEDSYVLTLNGEGEPYQPYVYNQLITSSIEGANLPIEEQNIAVNSVTIEIKIDKDSHQVKQIITGFEMNRKDDSQTKIKQKIERNYYDYDQNTKEIPNI